MRILEALAWAAGLAALDMLAFALLAFAAGLLLRDLEKLRDSRRKGE